MTNTQHAIELIQAGKKLHAATVDNMLELGGCIEKIIAEKAYTGYSAGIDHVATECRKQGVVCAREYLVACYRLHARCTPDDIAVIKRKELSRSDIIGLTMLSKAAMEDQLHIIATGKLLPRITTRGTKDYGLARSGKYKREKKMRNMRTDVDSPNNPDVIQISHNGEIDEEKVLNVLKNLCSRLGVARFGMLADRARREVGAR